MGAGEGPKSCDWYPSKESRDTRQTFVKMEEAGGGDKWRTPGAPRAGRGQGGLSPRACRSQPCRWLHFDLVASRTVRVHFCCFKPAHLCAL